MTLQEECTKVFEDMMMKCDDRMHHNYAKRLVERWQRRREWCSAFSKTKEEAAELTNNFCESAFR